MTTHTSGAAMDRRALASAARDSLRHPGFVVGAAMMLAFAAWFYYDTRNMSFRKEAVPLRKPLAALSKAALDPPYEFIQADTLNADVLNSLGTDKYLQWALADTEEVDARSHVKRVSLFVTYYTGQVDPVPHVPENCYYGSGYRVAATEDREMEIASLGIKIPVRLLEFDKRGPGGSSRPTVMYFFSVNGTYTANREVVRYRLSDPYQKYGYFSKVEIKFDNGRGLPCTRDELFAAGHKFMERLLPLLVHDHWPDWAAVTGQTAGAQPADAATVTAPEP